MSAYCLATLTLLVQIQDALGTKEEGQALVEVARNAHRAEQELATLKQKLEEEYGLEFIPALFRKYSK